MSLTVLVAYGRRLVIPLAALVLFLVVCMAPRASGMEWSELNTAPDEAAHYVTSLMIRSYLTDALGSNPRAFAEQYYLHYPKVAFGIWPPLFHLSLGVWLLLTGASLSSALLFVSLTTFVLTLVLFLAGRESLGAPLALAAALLFATSASVQTAATSVMMDMLCALLTLCATVAFARYLDSRRTAHALAFAVFAAAGLLTKYNALALVFVPPIAIVAARQWSVIKRPNFWLMPAVVAVLCAPWYLTHLDMVLYASEPLPPPGAWVLAMHANNATLIESVGIVAVPLTLIGVIAYVVRRRTDHALWCSVFALLVAVWGFHSFVYAVSGARYLLAAIAVTALFAAAGLHTLVSIFPWPRTPETAHRVRMAAGLLAVLVLLTWRAPPRITRGFAEAAATVLRSPRPADSTTLVSSDPIGEGAFVAYFATHEDERRSLVLRGSKLLASGSWMGVDYQSRYADRASLLTSLDRARVAYVVLDQQSDEAHHRLLDAALQESGDWMIVRTVAARSQRGAASDVRVYGRVRPLPPGKRSFELDTKRSFGYDVRTR